MRAWCIALLLGLVPLRALAHGLAPRALAPLVSDARGASIVQLSMGLAKRSVSGFEFVCPASWGGDEVAPAAPLDATRAAVATPDGLYALDLAAAKPVTKLAGVPIAMVNDGALLVLSLGDGYTLERITGTQPQTLWSAREGALAETSWLALAADAQQIVLAGERNGMLEQLTLSREGAVLEHASEPLVKNVLGIDAHLTREGPYLTLSSDDGQLLLGHFVRGTWMRTAAGIASMVGPVASTNGTLLVSVDGLLSSLQDGALTSLPTPESISGLASYAQDSYASTRDGLCLVTPAGCTTKVFAFEQLHAPTLQDLPVAQRDACLSEWQHLQVDLAASNLLTAPPEVKPEEPPAEGCGLALNPGGWPWILLLLALRRQRAGFVSRSISM